MLEQAHTGLAAPEKKGIIESAIDAIISANADNLLPFYCLMVGALLILIGGYFVYRHYCQEAEQLELDERTATKVSKNYARRAKILIGCGVFSFLLPNLPGLRKTGLDANVPKAPATDAILLPKLITSPAAAPFVEPALKETPKKGATLEEKMYGKS